jgi:predicted ATPase
VVTFTFGNFKCFVNARLHLTNPLTVLIGRNGAGKSNVVEGLELMAHFAWGRATHEVADVDETARGASLQIRGGIVDAVRRGKLAFELSCELAVEFEQQPCTAAYRLQISGSPKPSIRFEELSLHTGQGASQTVFRTDHIDERGLHHLEYDDGGTRANRPRVQLPSDRSVLSQYGVLAATSDRMQQGKQVVEAVVDQLRAIQVVAPEPQRIRRYARISKAPLARDGSNLSAVLHDLTQPDDATRQGGAAGSAVLNNILQVVKNLPEEAYSGFRFFTTELKDVMFGAGTERGTMDARLLSDGTLRAIAILTALETAARNAIVVVEEFDNGINMSRVATLLAALEEIARRRQLQVLCTTHNPAALDALTVEQMKGVVACHHVTEAEASELTPLMEVDGADLLLQAGHLGDLVTRRVLDQHLAGGHEAARTEQMRKWLESLP